MHGRLLNDAVLQVGDCADPEDLSSLADAVHAKTGSQQALVNRMRDHYSLNAVPANEGYLIAAALLSEGAVSSIVTLNFDVALTSAIIDLNCGHIVGIVEGPEHLPRQKGRNIYYLHRNANAPDAETWILRTISLQAEWQGRWEPVITARVLTAPVVVFAGLGTPVAVLIESARLMRAAIPAATRMFQVDPGSSAHSRFFQTLALTADSYIQLGWGDFMVQLSQRLLTEHAAQIGRAAQEKIAEDGLQAENLNDVLHQLDTLGLVKSGKLRAHWLLVEGNRYFAMETATPALLADLLLAVVMASRISQTQITLVDDGVVEFRRGATVVAAFLVASGSGHRGTSAIEVRTARRRTQLRGRPVQPSAVLVGGTSEVRPTPTPPMDVIRGDLPARDIVIGPASFEHYHIDDLRQNPGCVQELIP